MKRNLCKFFNYQYTFRKGNLQVIRVIAYALKIIYYSYTIFIIQVIKICKLAIFLFFFFYKKLTTFKTVI